MVLVYRLNDPCLPELGVNRLTLRAAISHLEAEGLLKAQQGQGVTVCDFHHTASLELLRYLLLTNDYLRFFPYDNSSLLKLYLQPVVPLLKPSK